MAGSVTTFLPVLRRLRNAEDKFEGCAETHDVSWKKASTFVTARHNEPEVLLKTRLALETAHDYSVKRAFIRRRPRHCKAGGDGIPEDRQTHTVEQSPSPMRHDVPSLFAV